MDKFLVTKKEKKSKKTQTNASINNINKSLNEEIDNLYKKPWVKLDRGSKINKLKEYAIENSISPEELMGYFNKGFLNKKDIINYDQENGKINNINCVEINDDGSYKLTPPQKKIKHKSTVKSKSNIERIINSTS